MNMNEKGKIKNKKKSTIETNAQISVTVNQCCPTYVGQIQKQNQKH